MVPEILLYCNHLRDLILKKDVKRKIIINGEKFTINLKFGDDIGDIPAMLIKVRKDIEKMLKNAKDMEAMLKQIKDGTIKP